MLMGLLAPSAGMADSASITSDQQLLQTEQHIRQLLKQEDSLEQSIRGLQAEGGTIDSINTKIDSLQSRKRFKELLVKWGIICPASFCINLTLAATGLENAFPPLSAGIAPAIGSFAMVFFFDQADKRWNKIFDQEIRDVIRKFENHVETVLLKAEKDITEAREVDIKNLDQALETLKAVEFLETEVHRVKQQHLESYLKDRKELIPLKTKILELKLEEAAIKKQVAIKQQQLKLVVSIRAKLFYGDSRFRALPRGSCRKIFEEIAADKGLSAQSPH